MCSIHLDINMRNGYKRTTALHESTLYGFKEGVRLISEHPETDLNCVDHQGQTATHYAVHAHQTECLRLLLIAGARIDIPCNNGQLPIHMAVMHGYDDCVSLLLDYKDIYHNNPTEINMISKENRLGYSTLEYTIMGGYKHTLDLIINFKSTEEITDKEKWVELTIVWNKIDCLRLLIEQGYPVHLNHLLTAVKQKKIDIVRELSKIVDLINNDNTSLLSAVGYGLLDTIPLLCNTTSKLCTLLNKGE
ncbi:ankyrin repeat-containing domain protein [Pilobolus umbonatus]|nr:ankyrin repeat-containing domain protein [Pilobolus umbonatus]